MYRIIDAVIAIIIATMAGSSLFFGYAYYEQQSHISALEGILNSRQKTIDKLLWRDSIATAILPFVDSSGVTTIEYRLDGSGRPLTYKEAIEKVDKEREENTKLRNQLETQRIKIKMVTDRFEIDFKESGNSIIMSYPAKLKLDTTSQAR